MLDNRIVMSPCAGAPVRRSSLLRTFTARIPLKTFTSGICQKGSLPGGYFASGARAMLLGADRFGLIFRRQLGRQIDLTGEIFATLDRMGRAGHRIFEDGALERFLFRQCAASRSCDRPLHG